MFDVLLWLFLVMMGLRDAVIVLFEAEIGWYVREYALYFAEIEL